MIKPNEYLESTFPQIKTEETFQKWISVKQVAFFISVCGLVADSKYKADGTQRKVYSGHTDKYDIHLYVSPVNGAGSIKIVNTEIVTDNINNENNAKIETLKIELTEYEEMIAADDKKDSIYYKLAVRKIEEIKKKIEILS